MPAMVGVVRRMPSGCFSPTGRTPQDRSRLPPQRSGVTAISSPPTARVPSHRPSWANRWVSKITAPRVRRYWRGSSNASMAPVQVTSMATPDSLGSIVTRSFRSGSITSTRMGPTERSARSSRGRLALTIRWVRSRARAQKASVTPRLGYWPSPMTAKYSSDDECRLK